MKNIVLFNPLSGGKQCEKKLLKLKEYLENDAVFVDITEIFDFEVFFKSVAPCDRVIVCGGDGTLNRFVNATKDLEIQNDILYFAAGSGNDFLNDLGFGQGCEPFSIKEYIKDLPEVFINGKSYRFLNNVGFGLDGYCCFEKERLFSLGKRNISYTLIALKGFLYAFRPKKTTVCVDGESYQYNKVWLAPTMNGRFFGGGMMIAPMQDRKNAEKKVTAIIVHSAKRLQVIAIFASVFRGTHLKYKKLLDVYSGNEISVKFDKPSPLQIDGEIITDVLEYKVTSKILEKAK